MVPQENFMGDEDLSGFRTKMQRSIVAITDTPVNCMRCGLNPITPPVELHSREIKYDATETPKMKRILGEEDICATPRTRHTISVCFQRHHIIPKNVWNVFGNALSKLNFGVDDAINLVSLPVVRSVSKKIEDFYTPSSSDCSLGKRSKMAAIHSGAHSKRYVNHIANKLADILCTNRIAEESLKRDAVEKFLVRTRNELLSGRRLLNAAKRSSSAEYAQFRHNKMFTYIKYYFHVHHIIPQKFFKKNSEIGQRLRSYGFTSPHFFDNLCELQQMEYLPESINPLKSPNSNRRVSGRSVHSGNHQSYSNAVMDKLLKILPDEATETMGPIPKKKILNCISKMLNSMRKKLCAGTTPLR
ncbi:MAG: AHH domain-containing protein [Puniceicoccales bacterium]|jgi:hypothetical protein|nr:AHH domain-containing protein [Puniceicoccales bacterium]